MSDHLSAHVQSSRDLAYSGWEQHVSTVYSQPNAYIHCSPTGVRARSHYPTRSPSLLRSQAVPDRGCMMFGHQIMFLASEKEGCCFMWDITRFELGLWIPLQLSSEKVAIFSVNCACWPNFRHESLGTRVHQWYTNPHHSIRLDPTRSLEAFEIKLILGSSLSTLGMATLPEYGARQPLYNIYLWQYVLSYMVICITIYGNEYSYL